MTTATVNNTSYELEIDNHNQECRLRIWSGPIKTSASLLIPKEDESDRPEICDPKQWVIAQQQYQEWDNEPF